MSTLATNKLGTLSGSADITLPSARPASTKTGKLDASGNLSFGDSQSFVNTMVAADTGKVGVVLVDQVCSDISGTQAIQSTGVTNTSGEGYYGYAVGVFNAKESDKTNYLFEGNIRAYELEFSYYNEKNSNGADAGTKPTVLDMNGNRLWKTYQNSNSMSGRTYENEDQNSAQYGQRDSYYANPTNASTAGVGGFYTYDGPGGGDALQGRITAIPAVNGAWTVHMMTNYRKYSSGSSNNRYPITNTAFLMPSGNQQNNGRTQASGGSSKGYGSPWEQFGGFLFQSAYTSGIGNTLFNCVMKAYIKPTTLATS